MKTSDTSTEIYRRLAEVRARRPELRIGQILATVGLLAEDDTGRSLWDVEDHEFAVALDRFVADLSRSETENG